MADHSQILKVIEVTAVGTLVVTPLLGGLFLLFSKLKNTLGRGKRRPQTDVAHHDRSIPRSYYEADPGWQDVEPAEGSDYDPRNVGEEERRPGAARIPVETPSIAAAARGV